MNSSVCIGIPTTSGWQGASGWAGSKLEIGEQAWSELEQGEWAGSKGSEDHICTVPYMHGAVYAWSCIHMEPYTHGAIYTWSHICMEPYTCGTSSLPLLPACSPCSLSIPGSLELSWGLRKPKANSPCFQLTTLAPSLLPLLPEHPWTPGTSLGPQEASSLLPLLPACCPCSLSIPGFLKLFWGLRKPSAHFPCPQACSPHSQLAPFILWASLGPWDLPEASGNPHLTPLAPGRSFRSSNSEGLRYGWDWVVLWASLPCDLQYRVISQ